jgi:hypothetical protein
MPSQAWAKFDVIWDYSDDTGQHELGYKLIGEWMVDNGYYTNLGDAELFAKTGYIGSELADPDPYYWDLDNAFDIEIVEENAGFDFFNTLGYYTGSGESKSLSQIFGGTEDGVKNFQITESFGLYLEAPKPHSWFQTNTWFTDRTENEDQLARVTNNEGGDPQALIYELKKDQEWLVAWEDLDATLKSSDNDYNDMFVKISVVPEPVSTTLFFLGGGVMTFAHMRRRKNMPA